MAGVNTTPSNEEWFADALPIVAARVRAVLRGHYDSELAKDLTQAVLTQVREHLDPPGKGANGRQYSMAVKT